MDPEIFNLGLEPRHAPSNARGGMKNIKVLFLPKGTTLFRFQTTGQGLGGFWSSPEVMQYLLELSAQTDFGLGTHARHASAVLHSWNEMNELVTGEVSMNCMAFTGMGRPQTEAIPHTNMRLTYSSSREVPQIFIPTTCWMTGRSKYCITAKKREQVKSNKMHGEHRQPVDTNMHHALKLEALRQERVQILQWLRMHDAENHLTDAEVASHMKKLQRIDAELRTSRDRDYL